MSTPTFRSAYGVLQRHAETLRNQSEPNIDDLLKIVTESVSAYKHCQARIEAVEQALEQALGTADAGPAAMPDDAVHAAAGPDAADDDDPPF
jgi:exodeoxyribonuclease VII small subunit